MGEPLHGKLPPLPSGGGLDAHLVDDGGAGAFRRRAFADKVEPARNIGIHIAAGAGAFDIGAMGPETDVGDGIEIHPLTVNTSFADSATAIRFSRMLLAF
jgi:hypothetical protein